MTNTQEYINTELMKTLSKMLFLRISKLRNLIAIIIGIIDSGSVLLSDIAQELKNSYSKGTEPSKIKRIYRFLNDKSINVELVYYYFIKVFLKKYRNYTGRVIIIFDHTTISDKFVILQFSLRVDNRTIPLWFRVFLYKEENNKNFKHIKEGLSVIHELMEPYNFNILVLADRGFRSIDLFKFIDEGLGWMYAIRCMSNTAVKIPGKSNTKCLRDIKIKRGKTKGFEGVLLTEQEYKCNMGVAFSEGGEEVWFIATNLKPKKAIKEYAKRFDIEQTFRDLKSNGFDMEQTWTENLTYVKNLYLCLCIAYTWMIVLGKSCVKDKKNKQLGFVRMTNNNKPVRVYSLFKAGIKWFKRCYNELKRNYHLKFDFILYEF